eukprot:357870-Rhodomonas_salina.2
MSVPHIAQGHTLRQYCTPHTAHSTPHIAHRTPHTAQHPTRCQSSTLHSNKARCTATGHRIANQ